MTRVSSAQIMGTTLSFSSEIQQISVVLFREIVDLLGIL
jgi:hypothetical protein